jgi:quercetin dioxygenase-like cupin family protein
MNPIQKRMLLRGANGMLSRSPLSSLQARIWEPVMELKRAGSQPSVAGPEAYFTGTVRIDPLAAGTSPATVSAASVTFEAGARSAWHTHPLGQILIVTAGMGWTQCEGGPIVEIRPGDTIHISVVEALDGKAVTWLEKVTDEDYLVGPPTA